jgi:hypothetical protein
VVTEQAGLAISFVLDSGRREHDVFLVLDEVTGQYYPELAFDELGHLFT